jgi:metal-responsive CopG/Arc/MetJ family transcriptional regulator
MCRLDTRIPTDLADKLNELCADSFWGSRRAAVEQALRLYLIVKKSAGRGEPWAAELIAEASSKP